MKQEDIFMLRRWRENPSEAWRFSLKDIHSGKTRFFSSEEALRAFLLKPVERLESIANKAENDQNYL